MNIEIKNLSKSYNGTPVLENLSMMLTNAKPVCLMGPSGRGKTTLFSILLGLIKADSGSITGIENKKFSAVFQEDRLCRQLSALMNLAIVQDNPDKAQLTALLKKMGLTDDEIRRPVSQLSGGQKRRVALVRAILAEKDVLFLDEPFKGLDEDTKKIVTDYLLSNIADTTVIMVTHDIDEAESLGAKVLNLKDGKITF